MTGRGCQIMLKYNISTMLLGQNKSLWKICCILIKKKVHQFCIKQTKFMTNTGLMNKGWYGMFFACGVWCAADIPSVGPSSEQTAITRNVSYTSNPTGKKHTISILVDQTCIQLTRQRRKNSFFETSLPNLWRFEVRCLGENGRPLSPDLTL